jgi:hypothetical protein
VYLTDKEVNNPRCVYDAYSCGLSTSFSNVNLSELATTLPHSTSQLFNSTTHGGCPQDKPLSGGRATLSSTTPARHASAAKHDCSEWQCLSKSNTSTSATRSVPEALSLAGGGSDTSMSQGLSSNLSGSLTPHSQLQLLLSQQNLRAGCAPRSHEDSPAQLPPRQVFTSRGRPKPLALGPKIPDLRGSSRHSPAATHGDSGTSVGHESMQILSALGAPVQGSSRGGRPVVEGVTTNNLDVGAAADRVDDAIMHKCRADDRAGPAIGEARNHQPDGSTRLASARSIGSVLQFGKAKDTWHNISAGDAREEQKEEPSAFDLVESSHTAVAEAPFPSSCAEPLLCGHCAVVQLPPEGATPILAARNVSQSEFKAAPVAKSGPFSQREALPAHPELQPKEIAPFTYEPPPPQQLELQPPCICKLSDSTFNMSSHTGTDESGEAAPMFQREGSSNKKLLGRRHMNSSNSAPWIPPLDASVPIPDNLQALRFSDLHKSNEDISQRLAVRGDAQPRLPHDYSMDRGSDKVMFCNGRPQFIQVFAAAAASAVRVGETEVAVLLCGNAGVVRQALKHSAEVMGGVRFACHVESFSF